MPTLAFLRSRIVGCLGTGICASVLLALCGTTTAQASLPKPQLLSLGAGYNAIFDSTASSFFGNAELRFEPIFLRVNPLVHTSFWSHGGYFLGAGLAYTFESEQCNWSASIGAAPGYYQHKNDVDLGGNFQVMSFAEVAYKFPNETRLALRFSHISNASTRSTNPGTEQLSLQYQIPLGRR